MIASLVSAADIGMIASLALGSGLAACAWLKAGVEDREEVSDISCPPAAWRIATGATSPALMQRSYVQGEEIILEDSGG
jgi:hypothetical protein